MIPRKGPSEKAKVQELQLQLEEAIKNCRILQVSKRRDRIAEGAPIDKEGSFLRPYLVGYDVHDPITGQPLPEPKAPDDVPLLEEDFLAHGKQDHDHRWWGVRLTAHDEAERGGGGGGYRRLA